VEASYFKLKLKKLIILILSTSWLHTCKIYSEKSASCYQIIHWGILHWWFKKHLNNEQFRFKLFPFLYISFVRVICVMSFTKNRKYALFCIYHFKLSPDSHNPNLFELKFTMYCYKWWKLTVGELSIIFSSGQAFFMKKTHKCFFIYSTKDIFTTVNYDHL